MRLNQVPSRRIRRKGVPKTPAGKQFNDKLYGILKRTIVDEMVRAAQAANLPEEFVRGIEMHQEGQKFVIENAWKSKDGAPLAVYFEHGTRDHWIEAHPLSWFQESAPTNPKAIYSQTSREFPAQLFSWGHYITGLPATEAMHNGFKIGMARMQAAILREKIGRHKLKVVQSG